MAYRKNWPKSTSETFFFFSWNKQQKPYLNKQTSDTHEMPLDFKKALKCRTDCSYSRSVRSRSFTNKHTSLFSSPSPFGSFLKHKSSSCKQYRWTDSTMYTFQTVPCILFRLYHVYFSDCAYLLPQYHLLFFNNLYRNLTGITWSSPATVFQ